MKQLTYHFHRIHTCNMCGSLQENHKILGKRLSVSQGWKPELKTGISVTVKKCRNCGLIFSDPLPVPNNLQDHYGVPPEDYWRPEYFNFDENYFSDKLNTLEKLSSSDLAGMKVLDVGAGIGKAMMAMQKRGMEVYGMEPSEPFYKKAIEMGGLTAEKLKCGTVEYLDYPDESFDFISFGVVLEHLYDPAKAIERTLRWLKKGGLIHIEVPSSNWLMSKLINTFHKLRGTDYVSNLSPMHEPFHIHEFSLKSFKIHAEKAGYIVDFHEYYVCKTFLPKWTDKILKPYMKRTNTGMQLCVWLRKNP